MSKTLDSAMLGKRAGSGTIIANKSSEVIKCEGLEFSELQYKPLEFFIPNPVNCVFDSSKTENYFLALRKDIEETGAIVNPLIALLDGRLLEGHGRLIIAQQLASEGKPLGKLPVRIVTSEMTEDEIKKRVYLGNLSRSEISPDLRIRLYSELWPDFYTSPGKAGRKSVHGASIKAQEVADSTGQSIHQIKRDAAINRKALEFSGGDTPTLEHIKEARASVNSTRKKKSKSSKLTVNSVYTKVLLVIQKAIESIVTDMQSETDERSEGYKQGMKDALLLFQKTCHDS